MATPTLSEAIPLVEEVVRMLARRHQVSADEADELLSRARLKLVENDGAVLAKFGGRSTLRTYLTTVVHRLLLDFRRQEWGMWRSSAAAQRLGPVAVRLEVLLQRDGRNLEEAVRLLLPPGDHGRGRAELEALAAKLPQRVEIRLEGEETLARLGVSSQVTEVAVLSRDLDQRARAVEDGLREALGSLTPNERLTLRMRFYDGLTVRQIALTLRLEEKPFYRTLERLLARLRAELETRGITAGDIGDVLGSAAWEPAPLLAEPARKSAAADV